MKYRTVILGLLLPLLVTASIEAGAATLLSANFNSGESGFNFVDDPFLGTSQPGNADGVYTASGGHAGTGGLQITLGGGSPTPNGSSGAWHYALSTVVPRTGVNVSFRYRLQIDASYLYDQFGRVMLAFDGTTYGRGSKAYVDHIGGSLLVSSIPFVPTTDWQQEVIHLGDLAADTHELHIGAYNNQYSTTGATTTLVLDDIVITDGNPSPAITDAQALVNRLSLSRFKQNIENLSALGDRRRSSASPSCPSQSSFCQAQGWIVEQLIADGFQAQFHQTIYEGREISNLYVTKIGTVHPDKMYIVSAHLDGLGGGGAADDDGSGVSLLMELAHVLGSSEVALDTSVRLVFWDREESSNLGSRAYVVERRALQGIEEPAGSSRFPEPTWVGMLQHDMILYDHGVRPASDLQSNYADLDVEWDHLGAKAAESRTLAIQWQHLNGTFSSRYPSTAYDYSAWTDDTSFRNHCPSISVRENRRASSSEWANPNWHAATDLYGNYSEADFELGFNAVQATLGTVATLTNAHIAILQDEIFRDGFDEIQLPE